VPWCADHEIEKPEQLISRTLDRFVADLRMAKRIAQTANPPRRVGASTDPAAILPRGTNLALS